MFLEAIIEGLRHRLWELVDGVLRGFGLSGGNLDGGEISGFVSYLLVSEMEGCFPGSDAGGAVCEEGVTGFEEGYCWCFWVARFPIFRGKGRECVGHVGLGLSC
jgi:hypothetical protein